MHIMCDFTGTLWRDNELDQELADALLALLSAGHQVTFVSLDPSTAGFLTDLHCQDHQIGSMQFLSRKDLTDVQREVDILIDDEADKNMETFDIQAHEVLAPAAAARILAERFPEANPPKQPEPAPL